MIAIIFLFYFIFTHKGITPFTSESMLQKKKNPYDGWAGFDGRGGYLGKGHHGGNQITISRSWHSPQLDTKQAQKILSRMQFANTATKLNQTQESPLPKRVEWEPSTPTEPAPDSKFVQP